MAKQSYVQANKDWLAEKAKEEGVMALPKGMYYKVLAEENKNGRFISQQTSDGKFSQPGIPGGSTLIFEIELLGVA